MVPPESLFGISNALLVLIVSLVSFGLAGFILWQRVFRLVLIGRKENSICLFQFGLYFKIFEKRLNFFSFIKN